MSIKLKNSAFPIILDRKPDTAIDVDNVLIKYKRIGTAGDMITANVTFEELATGSYLGSLSLPDAGSYAFNIEIPTTLSDGTVVTQNTSTTMVVSNTSLDLIQNSIDSIIVKVDGIADDVSALDRDELNSLKEATDAIRIQLTSITDLISDENNDGITSLKELLEQLSQATDNNKGLLSAIQSYITTATDDIENILKGSDTLADGTANPFKGNTNVDIMKQLEALGVALNGQLSTVKDIITEAINASKNELAGAIATVEGIVTGNGDLLKDGNFGLEEIKNVLDGFKTSNTDATRNLQTDVTAVITNLASFKNELASKIDAVKADTEAIKKKLQDDTEVVVNM